jgi:hypothetical protein
LRDQHVAILVDKRYGGDEQKFHEIGSPLTSDNRR